MRIHELLEACVEYVAIDGVLGSDSETLLHHLKTLDASLDQEFFAHIYNLLIAHPAIQVILTKHPLPSPDVPLELGTAPLPDDYVDASSNTADEAAAALRGRALAFHNEGKEYKTDKETIAANREAKRQKTAVHRVQVKAEMDESLMRFLGDDDGGEGEDGVETRNYVALRKKWGSRLRIRATDQEIYYRLTGSHSKIGKLTTTVFHVLQLAARSRAKGISAIELGPAVNSSQGSMHYFMKVLCQMGLCAKVPVVTHASVTNLLLFHRFLEQNAHYRASMRLPPLEPEQAAGIEAAPVIEEVTEPNLPGDDEEGDEDEEEDLTRPTSDWNLDFGPMSEEELMVGHVIKDRLLRLLDHPELRNHLLKRKNLLVLLGWQGPRMLRHRRAITRHTETLVHEGLVETIDVGERRTRCLRLTKYNPSYVPPAERPAVVEAPEEGLHTMDDESLVELNSSPYTHQSTVSVSLPLDYQLNDRVALSGTAGLTIADVRVECDYYFKRNIEFHFVRSETAFVPPQLRSHQICLIMDTYGRERRLRAFSLPFYRLWAEENNQPIDDAMHPPITDELGHWGSLDHRGLWTIKAEFDAIFSQWSAGTDTVVDKPVKPKAKPKPKSTPNAKRPRPSTNDAESTPTVDVSENDEGPAPRKRKYDSTVQVKGRPRKYIHVVNEDGKVNRLIIGRVLPHPDLEPIYIYIKTLNKLVPGPLGYAGLGPPPPITEADMKRARTVASFSKYESQVYESKDGSKSKGKGKAKGKITSKKDAEGKEAKGETKSKDKGKAAAVTATAVQNPSPADEGKGKRAIDTNIATTINVPNTADRTTDRAAVEASPVAAPASDIEMVDDLQDSGPDITRVDLPVTVLGSSHDTASKISQPVPVVRDAEVRQPNNARPSSTTIDGSQFATPGSTANLPPPQPSALANQQPQLALPPAAAAFTPNASVPSTPAIAKPAVKVGRKPKYTDAERGFPTYTPSASPAIVLSPLDRQAEPIVLGDFDSSVLLPRASKKHPAYVRDVSASNSPATPSARSASIPRQEETPVAGTMFARKRKGSPRSGSPSTAVSAAPASTTKKARANQSIFGSASSDKPPEISQDGLEVPLEWLQLREKMRRERAEKEAAEAAQEAARLKKQEEDEAERARVEAEKQAEAAAIAEEKAKKEAAREARASQRARTEADQAQRLAQIKAEKENDKIRKAEEKRRREEERVKKAEERAQQEAQKRAAKANAEETRLAVAKADSEASSAAHGEAMNGDDSNAFVGGGDDGATDVNPNVAVAVSDVEERSMASPNPTTNRPASPSIARSCPIPATPLASTPLSRYVPESTPLVELTPAPDGTSKSTAALRYSKAFQPRGGPKIDLGHVRRSNEVLQTLRETGQILEVNQFRKENWEWHKRWAGTDHPYAPRVATKMDRGVFIKCLTLLAEEGRLQTTTATIPTITGQIKQAKVYWLPEASKETVNTYIRSLGQMMTLVYSPKSRASVKIAATEFTEVRLPGQPGIKAKRLSIRPQPPSMSSQKLSSTPSVTPEQRRAILQQDSNAVPILYGYHSGRNARIATMHQGIVQTLAERPDAEGVFSASTRIFGLELLFNDIAASKWFKSVSWVRFSEELVAFLADPANKDEPLRNVPVPARPSGGFGGHSTKTKILSMLDAMAELKLLIPLVITGADDADFETKDKSGTTTWFKRANSVAEAMFFRVYDAAPVYHIASDAAGLLGVRNLQTTQQAETFWKIMRDASTLGDINALPVMERRMDHSRHAPLTDQLQVGNPDLVKNLRMRVRWKSGARLLDVQKSAIQGLVDPKTGEVKVNAEELEAFAYEWCLPLAVVQEHIDHRVDRVSQKKRARERDQEAIRLAYDKRKAAEEDLRLKLIEIRAANKAEWERRVRAAAERSGTEYSPELETFLARHSLHALKFAFMLPGRGPLTDEAMDEGCKMFMRRKAIGGSGALPSQEKPRAVKKAPLHRRTRKEKRVTEKPPRDPTKPLKRNRRQWTEDDDEMLLEGEAIIRARWMGRSVAKPGRQALDQIFPNVSGQVFRNRLKRLLARPGGQAYFDRLVDEFHELWVENQGSEELPDENPESSHEFDIKKHIAYLRAHIQREELRDGALQVYEETVLNVEDLPEELGMLLRDKEWDFVPVSEPTLENVWDAAAGDDIRSGQVGLVTLTDEPVAAANIASDLEIGKLKAALKMIVGHPPGDYHPDAAVKIVAGQALAQEEAALELLEEKIMRKFRQPGDGRQYQFLSSWVTSCEGPYPAHVFDTVDTVRDRFNEDINEDGTIEWPLMCNSGEMAAMMNMVSSHEAEFEFDHANFPTLQSWTDTYNTRKLNDIDLEFEMTLRRVDPLHAKPGVEPPTVYASNAPSEWDVEALSDEITIGSALRVIKEAQQHGLTKAELSEKLRLDEAYTMPYLLAALAKREVFWAGYDTARIVHRLFWPYWAVHTAPPVVLEDGRIAGVSQEPNAERLVAPRRWVDIYGRRVEEEWEKAKGNVLGWIVARPGMNERVLRHCIGSSLDRLETNEVLRYLVDTRVATRAANGYAVLPPVEAMDVNDEMDVNWWPASEVLWQ